MPLFRRNRHGVVVTMRVIWAARKSFQRAARKNAVRARDPDFLYALPKQQPREFENGSARRDFVVVHERAFEPFTCRPTMVMRTSVSEIRSLSPAVTGRPVFGETRGDLACPISGATTIVLDKSSS